MGSIQESLYLDILTPYTVEFFVSLFPILSPEGGNDNGTCLAGLFWWSGIHCWSKLSTVRICKSSVDVSHYNYIIVFWVDCNLSVIMRYQWGSQCRASLLISSYHTDIHFRHAKLHASCGLKIAGCCMRLETMVISGEIHWLVGNLLVKFCLFYLLCWNGLISDRTDLLNSKLKQLLSPCYPVVP